MIKRLKYVIERIFFGYTDDELKNLEKSFYNWLFFRLSRIKHLTTTYPKEYANKHEWNAELNRRLNQLDQLNISDKRDFTNFSYLTKELSKRIKTYPTSNLNIVAYNECAKDFNEWLIKNIQNLNI